MWWEVLYFLRTLKYYEYIIALNMIFRNLSCFYRPFFRIDSIFPNNFARIEILNTLLVSRVSNFKTHYAFLELNAQIIKSIMWCWSQTNNMAKPLNQILRIKKDDSNFAIVRLGPNINLKSVKANKLIKLINYHCRFECWLSKLNEIFWCNPAYLFLIWWFCIS